MENIRSHKELRVYQAAMDAGMRGRGDTETRRHGDAGTRRIRRVAPSPCLRVTVSPHRRVALSLVLLILLQVLTGCTASVRVEWSTETEMNTAGFNLYRGESADGPFDVKVNSQLIPPAKDPLTGGKYQYVDPTARPGVTYYYKLEEVEKTGATNSYGPISVRAGGLEWWQIGILVVLAIVAVVLWVFGGRKNTPPRPPRRDAG